jgi:hypothetical protein
LTPAQPAVAVATITTPSAVVPAAERPARIVPKGLRSFDAADADFFMDLLPGPRDRDGLPESLRFWKGRIEETDPDNTFSVALIYGPSGCGKSSLVKAGLLPRLAGHVITVYVEATGQETEARLLKGLRKHCPDLPAGLDLIGTLTALRRGQGLPAGKKALILLDQFEQWLHARRGQENTELVQALRQCDSGRVQCLVLVRDDFWLAVSRFMADLEVELLQGHNTALVDLFDPRHARKVLAAFGRAYGALPEAADAQTKEQEAFLDQAVAGLAQEGKVVSVRLALFAEVVKGRPWTTATLKEVGGTEGVGVTFLEETFAAPTAPPDHRLHQRAARAVLKALLPEQGTEIKGGIRSHEELWAASGYAQRPKDFEKLLRILDGDLRLVTPTDPEGKEDVPEVQGLQAQGLQDYQLTHDYLVPSLREWLTRKQRETRRGRAELRLAERAAAWATKPESRYLPAWWEWASIRLFTRRRDWTVPQRRMMDRAGLYYAVRSMGLAVLLVGLTVVTMVPYPLQRESTGYILPATRRWIYSPVTSTVTDFHVEPNQEVDPGQILITMFDADLRKTIMELIEVIQVSGKQIEGLRTRLQAQGLQPADTAQIKQDLAKEIATQKAKSDQLRRLTEHVRGNLANPGEFRLEAPPFPPMSGKRVAHNDRQRWMVLNSDFREKLINKAVKPDQPLLRLGDNGGNWEVELKIPQKHIGQIQAAFAALEKARPAGDDKPVELDVDLLVRSEPTHIYKGKMTHDKVAGEATPNKDEQNEQEPVVCAYVRLSGPGIADDDCVIKQRPDLLVSGTEVQGKVRCGNHPLGYVLFCGLYDYGRFDEPSMFNWLGRWVALALVSFALIAAAFAVLASAPWLASRWRRGARG